MIVILKEELFEGPNTADMPLVSLIAKGLKRHKIRLDPAYLPSGETVFHTWLARQEQELQEQIRLSLRQGALDPDYVPILRDSTESISRDPTEPIVVVERRDRPLWPDSLAEDSEINARLPLEVAIQFLERPLRVLLENGRNDWSFLCKIIPAKWRERWNQATNQGWIEPQNAGGLTEIPKILSRLVVGSDSERLRLWVMFDSDGRAPGHCSEQARDAIKACEDWSVPYHLLERRTIENYLPKSALHDWTTRRPDHTVRSQKFETLGAYCKMTPTQRHHYNIKEGFARDARGELEEAVLNAVEALYPAPLWDAAGPLFHGFHKSLGQDVWGDDPDKKPHEIYLIAEEALVAEGFEQERARLAQAIFGML